MIKPYRLKHKPTGLFFQPHKHRGSHLSKKGKIYQNSVHGLTSAFKTAMHKDNLDVAKFSVCCEKGSRIHKSTKDIVIWHEISYSRNQLRTLTLLQDWIVEEI